MSHRWQWDETGKRSPLFNAASNNVSRQQFTHVFALAIVNAKPNTNKFFDIPRFLWQFFAQFHTKHSLRQVIIAHIGFIESQHQFSCTNHQLKWKLSGQLVHYRNQHSSPFKHSVPLRTCWILIIPLPYTLFKRLWTSADEHFSIVKNWIIARCSNLDSTSRKVDIVTQLWLRLY